MWIVMRTLKMTLPTLAMKRRRQVRMRLELTVYGRCSIIATALPRERLEAAPTGNQRL